MNRLSDIQIERIFAICREIDTLRQELPAAPRGWNISRETAVALRTSLEQHEAALTVLATILATFAIKD